MVAAAMEPSVDVAPAADELASPELAARAAADVTSVLRCPDESGMTRGIGIELAS